MCSLRVYVLGAGLTAISPHMPCLQAVSTRTGLLHDLESKLAAETVCTAKYRRMVRQGAAVQKGLKQALNVAGLPW